MKMNVFTALSMWMVVLISGCCKEDDSAICGEVGIVIHEEDQEVYTSDEVDRAPYFDGGCTQCELEDRVACAETAYLESFYGKIKYPAQARENDIQGKVVIRFVIEKDGSVSNFEIVEAIGYGCEEEVIETIQMVVPWVPAILNGAYVRSFHELPVIFKLG